MIDDTDEIQMKYVSRYLLYFHQTNKKYENYKRA